MQEALGSGVGDVPLKSDPKEHKQSHSPSSACRGQGSGVVGATVASGTPKSKRRPCNWALYISICSVAYSTSVLVASNGLSKCLSRGDAVIHTSISSASCHPVVSERS